MHTNVTYYDAYVKHAILNNVFPGTFLLDNDILNTGYKHEALGRGIIIGVIPDNMRMP